MEEKKAFLPAIKKTDFLFPERPQYDFRKMSVLQRFSKQEIQDIIKEELVIAGLKKIPFEFAVSSNSLTGDQVYSKNYPIYFIF